LKEKVVLIGAGSVSFTRGLVIDLIAHGNLAQLALVDTDEDALAVAERLARKMIDAKHASFDLVASTNRRDVLPDATVVITTIGVGGRHAWELDVHIPRKYGIYQPVGDSVMPGGSSRALRMIPAMVDIANDVLDCAPGALFFNYGNPMAPVCRAIRKATGAEVIGLCHGVNHVAEYLSRELGTSTSGFAYTAIGMNHLTWFTEVRVGGTNAMPDLMERADEKLGEIKASPELSESLSPFSWQLLTIFGAFPAVLDRHVTEFFPHLFPAGSYYGKTLGVDVYSFEATIEGGDAAHATNRSDAFSDSPLNETYFERSSGEHEQVVDIIDSIRNDSGRIYSANLPNTGQVSNLPDHAIVESPAVADGGGLRPINQPSLPSGIAGTLATRMLWVDTIVDAALEGNRNLFVQALVLDGAVDSLDTATDLADELIEVHKEYLPQFRS